MGNEVRLSPDREARLRRLLAELPPPPPKTAIGGFDEEGLRETSVECGAILTRMLECLPDSKLQVNLLQAAIIGLLERDGRASNEARWIAGFCESLNRRWQERQGMKDYLRKKPGPLREPWLWQDK